MRPGLAVAIVAAVVVAAAACSKSTSSTGTSTPPVTGSPAPSATASAHFVGHWQRHASTLDITLTTATLSAGLGMGTCSQGQAACSENDTLAVTSGDDTQLTLTVTAVSYKMKDGQTLPVNPGPDPSTAVGDSIRLVWRPPGLLRQTLVKGFPGWANGIDWCGGAGTPEEKAGCGA